MRLRQGESTRILTGVCILAGVWVGVYWLWEPRSQPRLTFAPVEVSDLTPPIATEANTGQGASERADLSDQETREAPDPDTVGTAPARPGGGDGTPPAPPYREYVVRDGDTIERIAERELGSRSRASLILRANPLLDPTRLRPGRTIRVPTFTTVDPPPVTPPPDPPTAPATTERTHVVVSGESLSSIAKRYYGTEALAEFLFQSNREVLRDADSLRPGQVLRVPARSDGPP